MRIRSGALALALGACTPTGEVDAEPVPDDAPAPLPAEPDSVPSLPWPGCSQAYPELEDDWGYPFVWERDVSEEDHPCRFGCRADRAAPTSSAPGISVAIVDDEVRVGTAAWQVTVPAHGLVAQHVQWTSWCGESIALAIHDGQTLRMVSIAIASGEITETLEQPIDPEGGVDPSFAMQMHCWDQHTSIQARGRAGAWTRYLPTHGSPPRRVPADVWAEIAAKPFGRQGTAFDREEIITPTRRYHRKGDELYALDADGLPLWHRVALDVSIGCLYDEQRFGLRMCGNCGPPEQVLTLVGEHVILDDFYWGSSTDVFDAVGEHIVHISF